MLLVHKAFPDKWLHKIMNYLVGYGTAISKIISQLLYNDKIMLEITFNTVFFVPNKITMFF